MDYKVEPIQEIQNYLYHKSSRYVTKPRLVKRAEKSFEEILQELKDADRRNRKS